MILEGFWRIPGPGGFWRAFERFLIDFDGFLEGFGGFLDLGHFEGLLKGRGAGIGDQHSNDQALSRFLSFSALASGSWPVPLDNSTGISDRCVAPSLYGILHCSARGDRALAALL